MILCLPMQLPSVANQRIHWAVKAKQVKAQRQRVALAWKTQPDRAEKESAINEWERGGFRLLVTMIRVAPRRLDTDNLESAFKAIRDQVAVQLGVSDASERVRWECQQARPLKGAKPGVMIMIGHLPKDVANPCALCGRDRSTCGHFVGAGAL